MNDKRLLEVLKETHRGYRHYGPGEAGRQLDRAMRGYRPSRDRCEMIQSVMDDLRHGMANVLTEAINYMEHECRRDVRDGPSDSCQELHTFVQTKMREMTGTEMMFVGATTGRMSSSSPNLQELPKGTTMNKTIQQLEAELEAARAAEAKRIADAAKAEQLAYLAKLAAATSVLITFIQGGNSSGRSEFVAFRKELQPLANELGHKIVMIGDRTTAALVSL
jgi:hypothetical protein